MFAYDEAFFWSTFRRMKTYSADNSPAAPDSRSVLLDLAANMKPDSFSTWGSVMLLYFGASLCGLVQVKPAGVAAILWPANGLLLAFVLKLPRRFWFSYLAGGVVVGILATLFFPYTTQDILIYAAANTIEVILAALWIARDGPWRPDLTHLRVLGKFVLYGVLLAPLVSTAAIAVFLVVFDSRPADLLTLSDWFVGDAIGIGIMTPLILAMHKHEIAWVFRSGKRIETIVLLVGLTAISCGIFGQTHVSPLFFSCFRRYCW